jgi:hypothetical protein
MISIECEERMKSWSRKIYAWATIAIVPFSLLELTRPNRVIAAENQFDVCVRQIVKTGVSGQDAGQACADALIPKELSWCVTTIQGKTPIDGNSALLACYQVRRPVDLGNCVVDIHRAVPAIATTPTTKQTEKKPSELSLKTLESCRKSLLPGRFSECVIALSRDVDKRSPGEALATCLNAEDFPRDLFPAYPQNQGPGQ